MGTEIQPGDWVRFYRSGGLILGIVQYVRDCPTYPYEKEALTDVGAVAVKDIVEVRPTLSVRRDASEGE